MDDPRKIPDNLPPTLSFDFTLVEHGYEMNFYVRGEHMGFECRDFGGDHKIADLAENLLERIQKAVNEFREAH